MFIEQRHLYHPFPGSYLGFWVNDEPSRESSIGYILEDIDLYYQPVHQPILASVFFIIKIILVIIGLVVNIKVWIMVDKENGLVKDVTKIYSVAMLVNGPLWLIFSTSTDFIHPLNEVIGQWYCDFGWFSIYLSFFIISFHSFIVAIMRYLFIVHEKKIEAYGKQKIRKIFHVLSFLLPLFMMMWSVTDKSDVDAMSPFNKCYGSHHKVFLFDTSTLKVAKRNFCEHVEYDSIGHIGNIISKLRRYACIIRTLLILFMGFNFIEGIIYYRILTYTYK